MNPHLIDYLETMMNEIDVIMLSGGPLGGTVINIPRGRSDDRIMKFDYPDESHMIKSPEEEHVERKEAIYEKCPDPAFDHVYVFKRYETYRKKLKD